MFVDLNSDIFVFRAENVVFGSTGNPNFNLLCLHLGDFVLVCLFAPTWVLPWTLSSNICSLTYKMFNELKYTYASDKYMPHRFHACLFFRVLINLDEIARMLDT